MPSQRISRRKFLAGVAATGAVLNRAPGIVWGGTRSAETVTVGVMGLKHGSKLAIRFARQAGVRVKYVCDVDERRVAQCRQYLESTTGQQAEGISDFRRILDDREVDALVCAAPNHWHATATILACAAGKHVYVEKPCSHNPREGELMIDAARKYRRVVQVGLQRRSSAPIREAMAMLREGAIGRVYSARAAYYALRPPVGIGKPAPVPPWLDYELWQGPAPRKPYLDNRIHYNWHFFWHWGNGDLGNHGVHSLDICRWGLQGDYPLEVTASGGRYRYDDDQETPDTLTAAFTFAGRKAATWQGWSCNRHEEGSGFATFFGEHGALAISRGEGYTLFDEKDKVVREVPANWEGLSRHIDNFLTAVRAENSQILNCDIAEGHKSTLLTHLGNIAYRVRKTLRCSREGRILDDPEAMALWGREYESGWEPHV